jgi:hypothetical protein
VRGDWKVRRGQVIPGKGPEWMGIRHHEQNIGLPSKWGFLFAFNPLMPITTSFDRFCENWQRMYKMVKIEFHFIKKNEYERRYSRKTIFETFLTVRIFIIQI